MTLRELLLNKTAEPAERLPVIIAGERYYVREMSAAERDDFEVAQIEAGKEGKALENFRAKLLTRVLVNEDGSRALGDEDAALLGKLGAKAIRRAFDTASKLNAITPEDAAELTKKS